ncbi:hypothetical protein LRP50_02795 [Enterovibrio sp. ZSDZ42]|uniref:DUF6701 domain-containing protein n=1 Tax=Enterovibrio gelatinilyticus TaxID=2899819 RepID=A0ABT5QVL0_9GAMM|nr:DUF6701 domain-containing protein [Enterovibrio sp. ZSDZ42]MDD1792049.1 hypothetical protein [Enterovibrio sp. ZSDZ42]
MRRIFGFILCMISSLSAFAGTETLFPGPAQSPKGMDNTLFDFRSDSGLVLWDGNRDVRIGFEVFDFQSNGVDQYCSDGEERFACIHDPNFRAKDLQLQELVIGDGENDLVLADETWLTDCGYNTECLIKPSEPNYSSYTVGSQSTLYMEEGVYYFGTFTLSDSARLIPLGKVELHVNEFLSYGANSINPLADPRQFIVYHHNQTIDIDDRNSKLSINFPTATRAYFYSSGLVHLQANAELYGSVTARQIHMNDNAKIFYAGEYYNYELHMDPLQAQTNTCSRIPITFKVTNDKGEQQAGISGDLTVKATNHLDTACWATSEGGNCVGPDRSVTLTAGSTKLWLQNKAIGTVNVEATFKSSDTGKLTSEQGNYTFKAGGFRFSPSPLKMVAGKPEKLSIEAVYGDCDPTPIPDYEGTKRLKFGEASYLQPTYTGGAAPTKPAINDKSGEQTLNVNFVDGRANNAVTVRYADAGALSIPVEEVSAGKSGDGDETDIPEAPEKNAETEKLRGDATLHVRPYTFAICDVKAQDKGQSKAADAFTYAGAPFSAYLRPVVWLLGDKTDSSLIDLSGKEYCSRLSTPSFWHPDAPDARVTINNTAQVVTPTGGTSASVSGATNQNHTEAINGRYEYPSLSLNNVGTFKLRSRVVDSYLGMTVNRADLPVGRFYPSHFMVTPEFESGVSRSHDSLHQGFTYLGQPFSGVYVINAATTFETPVSNYHLRSDKAVFDGWVIDPVSGYPYAGTDLTTRWAFTPDPSVGQQGQWKAGKNGESEWVIDGQMSIVKDAVPESPFTPLRFAVGAISFDQDNTDFVYCADASKSECEMRVIKPQGDGNLSLSGVQIATDDFYFGRMRIEGFTETQDLTNEQTLPVAVEVFNGTHFVTNTRDNATIVSTEIGKKDVLFSDKTNNAALQAKIELRDDAKKVVKTKNVKEGRAEFHVIPPDQSAGLNREQFRYWQQLDKAVSGVVPQTWLQHNWQGSAFDDDPSAIGVFGFYRGSDRVIYKGEKNITLTGE